MTEKYELYTIIVGRESNSGKFLQEKHRAILICLVLGVLRVSFVLCMRSLRDKGKHGGDGSFLLFKFISGDST